MESEEEVFVGNLTPMQLRFAEEYVKDSTNATAAAKRAGFTLGSARQKASEMLLDPRVQQVIKEASEKALDKLQVTEERIIQELAVIAFSNPKNAITYNEAGEPEINLQALRSDSSGATEVTISAVKGKYGKSTVVSVKTVKPADKVAALEKLGKHLGMFKDQVEITGKLTLADLVNRSYDLPQPTYEQIESLPIING